MNSPGLQLFFSHDVEQLAARLAVEVATEQQQGRVFIQPQVVVPNANMQRYLQLQLAAHNGVCANVAFPFLETGLLSFINQVTGQQINPLSQDELSWAMWRFLLADEWRSQSVYQPLKRYLSATDNARLNSTKHWQVSRKLAKLLLDYEAQRPEMILDWIQGQSRFGLSEDRQLRILEALQKDLYLSLHKQTGQQRESLFQAMLRLDGATTSRQVTNIHVFTPSRLSQLHRKILNLLGVHFRVNIYQLNVCREYWEDVSTPAETRWLEAGLHQVQVWPTVATDATGATLDDPKNTEQFRELSLVDDENPLLSAWGKPGREALKLFSELETEALHCEVQFTEQWLESEARVTDSLLHTIQQQILHRRFEKRVINQHLALSSLQLASAPSIEREVTAVYQSIVWNLNKQPGLSLSDVAVLVTDMPAYRFVIEQVFEEQNQRLGLDIPYAIVDSSVATESRYADAVRDLLQLLDDQLQRSSVFRWLDNPCVQNALHISADDWSIWLDLVAQLGIYAGYENLYGMQGDTGAEPFTWQQGLSRLRLALAIDQPDDEAAGFPLSSEALGQLTELISSLHDWQQRLQATRTTEQWQKLLLLMLEQLIAVPDDMPHELPVQMALFESMNKLAAAEPDLLLGWHDIKQFIMHELQQIPAGKGQYLTGGVVFAALQPMRPIPFRITYVLGLGESVFPGRVSKETLDLTHRSRRIGDLNTTETNQYLFLETLMCTRDRLYLSYVGHDLVKDETLAASPVFDTLRQFASQLLDPDALDLEELPVHELPLLAEHSRTDAGNALDWPDIMVNYSSAEPSAQHVVHLETMPEQAAQLPDVIDIKLNELAAYLSNPQRQLLIKHGMAPGHPEDEALVEHEPFAWPVLSKHRLFTETVNDWLSQPEPSSFEQLIKQRHQVMVRHSQAPVELYASLDELSRGKQGLLNIRKQLDGHQYLGDVLMGEAHSESRPGLVLPATELTLSDGQQVRLHSLAHNVWHDGGVLSHQQVVSSKQNISEWNDKLLMPFLHWCLWQLSDQPVAAEHRVHISGMNQAWSYGFQVVTDGAYAFGQPAVVKDYLVSLVEDYVNEVNGFLPMDKLSTLQVSYKQAVQQHVPVLKKTSRAKTISFLAYLENQLDTGDRQQLNQSYLKAMQWNAYDEVFQLLDCQPMDDYLATYRRRLLPLYYQVFGVPADQARGHV